MNNKTFRVKKVLADGTIKYYNYKNSRYDYKKGKGIYNEELGRVLKYGIPFNKHKIDCTCGKKLKKSSLRTHLHSEIHKKLLLEKTTEEKPTEEKSTEEKPTEEKPIY